jgi:XRE family transcriptional regulator|nr:MAG TPA: putative zinc finger/helix-turn-helix protein, YgiT family [Caudoviricetes sp.]
MIDAPELGYTPANLKALRQKYDLTQQSTADLLNVNISALQRWEADVRQKSHRDMPHTKWLKLLEYLKNK